MHELPDKADLHKKFVRASNGIVMSVLTFSANQHKLLTSAKAPRPGLRLLELDAGILDEITRGRLALLLLQAPSLLCSVLTACDSAVLSSRASQLPRLSYVQKIAHTP